jgi:Stigma-specific protein, Stig1
MSDADATGGDASEGEAETDASDAAALSDVVDAAVDCDAADACSGSLSCCSSACVDLRHDPRNCGTCGNGCGASQFCTGIQCLDAVFTNVCANPAATVVEDPYVSDNEAGIALGQALVACAPDAGVAVSVVPQTQAGILIPGDAGWQPNTGVGNTLVVGGGFFGQLSVASMDDNGLTPVYLTNDGTTAHIYQRATGLPLVTAADTTLTSQHDFFFLELAVEPKSGTLCLFGEGIYSPGTVAAGFYGSTVVVPEHASATAPWYVGEWTDSNSDGVPDQGDTFTVVAQGP